MSYLKGRRIYIPYMSNHAFVVASAFEACGIDASVMAESDEETINIGRKFTTGRECFPCILTTGDMVKLVKSNGFDPDRSAFFMPSGCGPCRFGQYNRFHRLVLDNLGYKNIHLYSPNQDEGLYLELGALGNRFISLAWQGVVATDILEKKLRETRPYEINKGETESIFYYYMDKICEAIREGEDIKNVLIEARDSFDSIEKDCKERKPIIGIVGEIYIRSNVFSNENLVKEIERLGGEAWVAPIGEWIFYTNFTSKRRARNKGNYKGYMNILIKDKLQYLYEQRLLNIFEKSIDNLHEPKTEELLKLAKPYIDSSFEGEAILSIGKAIDYINKGVSGIISVMPFSCMPGNIVNAILKRIKEDNNGIPYLNIVYEGFKETHTLTRIEAFIFQTLEYKNKKKSGAQEIRS
jgi:predicted nucleotide-binding protein (sugar kinase/HSP70/actin superfamily)